MKKHFPTPDSIVARHNSEKKDFQKTTKRLNKILVLLYRIKILPLIGLGRSILIIETKGRKTGKTRYNPTLYFTFYTNKLTIYSAKGKKANWMKNILAQEDGIFTIHKGLRKKKVTMNFIEEEEERLKHLKYFCENYGSAKRIFGYDRKKDSVYLETEEFKEILNFIEFIQLEEV